MKFELFVQPKILVYIDVNSPIIDYTLTFRELGLYILIRMVGADHGVSRSGRN
jgi:hypothetical protein